MNDKEDDEDLNNIYSKLRYQVLENNKVIIFMN
jgi:hypothetical protein